MKKTVIILSMLCSVYAANVKAQGCTTPINQDDFNSPGANGWTAVDPVAGNGTINVTGGVLNFSPYGECASILGACNGREMRISKPLSHTLNNNTWRAECKFRITNGNGVAHTLLGFTASNIEPEGNMQGLPTWVCGGGANAGTTFSNTNQDGIFASIIAFGNNAGGSSQVPYAYNDQLFTTANQTFDVSNPSVNFNPGNMGWRIYGHAKNNNGNFYPSQAIAACNTTAPSLDYSRGISLPALNTDYYLRLERLSSGSCMISIFSDAAMLNHVQGSPQCFYIETDITNLNTMQNFTHQSGTFYRSTSGYVDDVKVFDQCPAIPVLTASPTNNASICAGGSTLVTATSGFSSYSWVGPGIVSGGTSNWIWVTPPSTTVYTVYATYPGLACPIAATVTVTVTPNPYINFNPDFSLVGTQSAGNNTNFTASATPVPGSTNYDISVHGGNYGYSWKVEYVNASGVSTTIANNPSNWWVSINPYAPFYGPQYNTFCGVSGLTMNTGAGYFCNGTFDLDKKYRITRAVWNPCVYAEKAKLVYFCTNCRSENGKPVMIVEDDVEYNSAPHTREINNMLVSGEIENVVSIYPNPSNGTFSIETVLTEDQTIEVFDINGKMVLKQIINGKANINASDLPDGIYNIKITGANTITNKRIVIAR